jgi:hypothetical protein
MATSFFKGWMISNSIIESFGSAMSEKGEGADGAAGRHSHRHQRVRREREVERELRG